MPLRPGVIGPGQPAWQFNHFTNQVMHTSRSSTLQPGGLPVSQRLQPVTVPVSTGTELISRDLTRDSD